MRDFDWQIPVTLHKTHNISKTAELLYVSQPTLTKRIQVIEDEGLVENAAEMGEKFRQGLQDFVEKYDDLLEVRGKGLLVGLVVKGSAKEFVDAFRDQNLLCCVAGEHVVRFLPPLNITEGDLEECLEMMSYAFDELYGEEE